MVVPPRLERAEKFAGGVGKDTTGEIEGRVEQFLVAERNDVEERVAGVTGRHLPGMIGERLAQDVQIVVVAEEFAEHFEFAGQFFHEGGRSTVREGHMVPEILGAAAPIVQPARLGLGMRPAPGLARMAVAAAKGSGQVLPAKIIDLQGYGALASLAQAVKNVSQATFLFKGALGPVSFANEQMARGEDDGRAPAFEEAPGQVVQRAGQGLGIAQLLKLAPDFTVTGFLRAEVFCAQRLAQKLHRSTQFLEVLSDLMHGLGRVALFE